MQQWKRLDLRRKESMPKVGALVVLRLDPLKPKCAGEAEYDVGWFIAPDQGCRKVWWHGNSRNRESDPVKLNRRYQIYWVEVPEFDNPW